MKEKLRVPMRVDTGSNPAQTRNYFFLLRISVNIVRQFYLTYLWKDRSTWEPVMAEELVQLRVMTRSP